MLNPMNNPNARVFDQSCTRTKMGYSMEPGTSSLEESRQADFVWPKNATYIGVNRIKSVHNKRKRALELYSDWHESLNVRVSSKNIPGTRFTSPSTLQEEISSD